MSAQEAYGTDPAERAGRKRNSAKALVQVGGRVLFTVNRDAQGEFLLLPGGGQRFGETLHEAVARETMEETGWLVEPGPLVLVREYIGRNHEFGETDSDIHQTEFVFLCRPVRREAEAGAEADAWQTGTAWLEPGRLDRRIYPSVLAELLPRLLSGAAADPLYLGDVN